MSAVFFLFVMTDKRVYTIIIAIGFMRLKEVPFVEKTIVTISRQFGSGGRSVGKELAQRMDVPYYDRELVERVALETGFDPRYIEEQGESAPGKSMLSYVFSSPGVPGVMKGLSSADFLWCMQHKVITELAQKGPCVIVGRCSDYILREFEQAFHVFIWAPVDFRADRIVRLYGESEESPEQRLETKDKKRSVNYKHYAGREWGNAQNYDLCLNSASVGIEKGVDEIFDLL